MNDGPRLPKTAWQVYTTDAIYTGGVRRCGGWAWVAYGPRGSESGIEDTADAAVQKAYAAALLLDEPAPPARASA